MMGIRRSLARSIDGKHDSSWIRKETEEINEENEHLSELGNDYRSSHDWLVSEIERIEDAQEMDPGEKIAILRQLRESLHQLQTDAIAEVEQPMDDNIDDLRKLESMAESNAVEHGERISTLEQGDGKGLVDVTQTTSDLKTEKTALEAMREETSSQVAARMAYLRQLRKDMTSVRRNG